MGEAKAREAAEKKYRVELAQEVADLYEIAGSEQFSRVHSGYDERRRWLVEQMIALQRRDIEANQLEAIEAAQDLAPVDEDDEEGEWSEPAPATPGGEKPTLKPFSLVEKKPPAKGPLDL
jgi:hypothetical protein